MKSFLLSLTLTFALAPFMQADPVNISKVKTDQPIVALTFDDGPNGQNMSEILDVLAADNTKATFFLIGKNVKKEPELARETLKQGHEIANHSMTHPRLSKLDHEKMVAEIVDTQKVIEETVGVAPVLFRAPFLDINAAVLETASDNGMVIVGSSRSVGDWQKDITVEKIIERAAGKTKAGDIILMHSWSPKSKEALPEIIAILKKKGLRCVTVSELLASSSEKAE